jgi:hypothetical protein
VRRGVRSSPKESAERQLKRKPKNVPNEKPSSVISVSGEAVHVQSVVPAVSTNANALVQCQVVGWIPAEIGG